MPGRGQWLALVWCVVRRAAGWAGHNQAAAAAVPSVYAEAAKEEEADSNHKYDAPYCYPSYGTGPDAPVAVWATVVELGKLLVQFGDPGI